MVCWPGGLHICSHKMVAKGQNSWMKRREGQGEVSTEGTLGLAFREDGDCVPWNTVRTTALAPLIITPETVYWLRRGPSRGGSYVWPKLRRTDAKEMAEA